MQRRTVYDRRLRGERPAARPMFWIWGSVEGTLLKVAEAFVRLSPALPSLDDLSYRLDLASECEEYEHFETQALIGYFRHRMRQWDPEVAALGEAFLDRHVGLCEDYAAHQFKHAGNWPPRDWLIERLDPTKETRSKGLDKLTLLMLPGDELWSYSSPPETWEHMMGRSGIALLRDGRTIAQVITLMN